MPTINVDGSADRLLAQGTTEAPGRCLEHVWIAIGQGQHYITGGGESAAATAAAVPAANRHYDINNIPAGYPIFLDRDVFISRGISNGVGDAVATDWPHAMQIGVCTVAQRLHQTGEKFQFWADSMGGYNLTSTSTSSSGTPSPIAPTNRKKRNTMITIIVCPNTSCAFLIPRPDGTIGKAQITDPAVLGQWSAFGVFPIKVSQASYDAYVTL